jgi:DNA polymerase IV (DinB-like DNA polymerase)
MLMDLDYFFAQCEELRSPSLRDKAVVVGVYSGRTEDSGAVSTANYVARKYGVKSGMSIFQAKKKLEDAPAVFLPVDYPFYEEFSERAMNLLRPYANRFEQVGIDEAYLDVTRETNADFENSRELAQKIKSHLKSQVGLTCSMGIGPNKLIAKMAADSVKPDGLTIIQAEQVPEFLDQLPVTRLIGVGVKTREKMQALGIHNIGQLAEYDVQRLINVFGQNLGMYFHSSSLGQDDEPVERRSKVESVSRISTLKQNTRDLDLILEETDSLCQEVVAAVLRQKLLFRTVEIIVVMSDMSVHSRSKTLGAPTNECDVVKKTVRDLFEKFLGETSLEARRAGVKVSNFVRGQDNQKKLASFID